MTLTLQQIEAHLLGAANILGSPHETEIIVR